MRIGILGGGLTGVILGQKLHEAGIDFMIFERDHEVGGLCRTLQTDEFLWDYGVHAMYSKSEEAMEYFHKLPLEYQYSDRQVRVCHWGQDGKIYELEYPFENGLNALPVEEKADCLEGYMKSMVNGAREYSSLKDWIDNCLGFGISKYFMTPYNEKIWNCDLEKISMGLVSNKIEPAPIRTIIKTCLGEKSIGRQYQAKFIYPKGGIGKLPKAIAQGFEDKIQLNCNVKSLSKNGNKWSVMNLYDSPEEFDHVVSTIPLTRLLRMIDLPEVETKYDVFHYNNTNFYLVGLKEGKDFQRFRDCHWLFFAGPELFYRITIMNNFDSDMPVSLVAEVTPKNGIDDIHPVDLQKQVINDLIKCEMINDPDDIKTFDSAKATHTYPIPTVGLDKVKLHLKTTLPKHNLHLLGRNGGWDYINMDGVVVEVNKFMEKMNW